MSKSELVERRWGRRPEQRVEWRGVISGVVVLELSVFLLYSNSHISCSS